MNKITVLTVLVLAFCFITPVLPHAHAASVVDTLLTQAVSQKQFADKLQQLTAIKQALDQGNKDELLGMLAQNASDRIGNDTLSGAVTAVARGEKMDAVIQTAINQAAEEKLNEKLGKYRENLADIIALLENSDLIPKSVRNNNSLARAPQNYLKALQMTATAYAPGVEDNGRWNNLTFLGGQVHKGVAAVDPKVIPMGSKLWVEGYGEAVAEDQGSAIKGNRIDLAFNSRQEALDYGISPVRVYVLK